MDWNGFERQKDREKPHCECSVRCLWRTLVISPEQPTLSFSLMLTDSFLLCWWPGGPSRGEKLNVASCDLHNKIRISPVVFSCLLVAVVDWATLGTASLKSLPGSSGPQRILGSNVQLNWWEQFIRIKTPSTSKAAWGSGQSLSFRSQPEISYQEDICAAFFHSFDYVTGGKDSDNIKTFNFERRNFFFWG